MSLLSPPLPADRRRKLLLAALVGVQLGMALAIAFVWGHLAPYRDVPEGEVVFVIILGFYYAQSALLGLWAALAVPVWTRRLPPVLFLLGLSLLAAVASIDIPFDWLGDALIACMATVGPFAAMLLLLPLRRYGRWRLTAGAAWRDAASGQPAQFSLGRMLLWMAGIAVLLAVTRLMIPQEMGELAEPFVIAYLAIWLAYTAGYSTLAAWIACAPYEQEKDQPRAILAGLGIAGLFVAEVALFTSFGVDFDSVLEAMAPLRASHLVMLLGSLLILRWAGYRLRRLPRPARPGDLPPAEATPR